MALTFLLILGVLCVEKKNSGFRIITEEELFAIEEKTKKHKKKGRIRNLIIFLVLLLILVGCYLLVHYSTFTKIRTIDLFKSDNAVESSYLQFEQGVLKYSKDGVSYLDRKAKEAWNQPYEMKNPILATSKKRAAVADKGGNVILILDKKGFVGEVKTTAPIEKISVSDIGIVCAMLSNDVTPEIICYDTEGETVVEHKASISKSGFPVDATISANGKTLMVSYLEIDKGKMTSKVKYYNFSTEKKLKVEEEEKTYENTIVPMVFFVKDDLSVHVGDNQLDIERGTTQLKNIATLKFKSQISSVAYNDHYIAIMLKNKVGHELRLYNTRGKKILSKDIEEEYSHMKIVNNQIVMYDGTKCGIIMKDGVMKFKGDTKQQIYEIFPVFGVNKYIVVSDQGFELSRLVK